LLGGSNFFPVPVQTEIIFNFIKFVANKKGKTTYFSPSSFVAVVGSGIQDPVSGMDKIRIRDKR
jgi:hypothetical protein